MQLGPSGGGGSGFNPDQYNAQSFSFFNPSAMMTGRRRALSKLGHSNETGSNKDRNKSFYRSLSDNPLK